MLLMSPVDILCTRTLQLKDAELSSSSNIEMKLTMLNRIRNGIFTDVHGKNQNERDWAYQGGDVRISCQYLSEISQFMPHISTLDPDHSCVTMYRSSKCKLGDVCMKTFLIQVLFLSLTSLPRLACVDLLRILQNSHEHLNHESDVIWWMWYTMVWASLRKKFMASNICVLCI